MLRGWQFLRLGRVPALRRRLSNRPYMVDDYFGFRVARTVR